MTLQTTDPAISTKITIKMIQPSSTLWTTFFCPGLFIKIIACVGKIIHISEMLYMIHLIRRSNKFPN